MSFVNPSTTFHKQTPNPVFLNVSILSKSFSTPYGPLFPTRKLPLLIQFTGIPTQQVVVATIQVFSCSITEEIEQKFEITKSPYSNSLSGHVNNQFGHPIPSDSMRSSFANSNANLNLSLNSISSTNSNVSSFTNSLPNSLPNPNSTPNNLYSSNMSNSWVESGNNQSKSNIFSTRKYLLPLHLQPEVRKYENTWKTTNFVNGKAYLEINIQDNWNTKNSIIQVWCGIYKRNLSEGNKADLIAENVTQKFLIVNGDGTFDEIFLKEKGVIVQNFGTSFRDERRILSGQNTGVIDQSGPSIEYGMMQSLLEQQGLLLSHIQSLSTQVRTLEQKLMENENRIERRLDVTSLQVENMVEQALRRMRSEFDISLHAHLHSTSKSDLSTVADSINIDSKSPDNSESIQEFNEEWINSTTGPQGTVDQLSDLKPLLEKHSSTNSMEIRIIESEFDKMQRFNHPLLMNCFDNLLRNEYINGDTSPNSLLQYLFKHQTVILENGDDTQNAHERIEYSPNHVFITHNIAPNPPPEVRLRILTANKEPVLPRDGFFHLQPKGKYRLQVENGLSESVYYSLLYWDHKHVIHVVGNRISELKGSKLKKYNLNVFQSGIAERYKLLFTREKPPCASEKWYCETLSIWVEPEQLR